MKAESLKVTFLQADLIWENPEENKRRFEEKLSRLNNIGDIILLPEMFTTGFSMNVEALAEKMTGPSVAWMKRIAAEHESAVAGSIIIEEEGKNYNRFVWVNPNGATQCYDKRHLFRMANENAHFDSGNAPLILTFKGWRIALQVCYDLRFPVYSRNRVNDLYDAVFYVANWPAVRSHPWLTLLMARAMENQAYVVGVNRIGKDANAIEYTGDSLAVDPKGNVIEQLEAGKETSCTVEFSLKVLEDYREKFPVLKDADDFKMNEG